MKVSLPGLGIGMIIASSQVDGTVPSLEILLNRSNRNFWELSDKSRYHLVWDIVTSRGNSYSRAAKQSPSPYEKMARCMKVLLQSYQRITLDVVLIQSEGWKIGQYMMLQRSFLICIICLGWILPSVFKAGSEMDVLFPVILRTLSCTHTKWDLESNEETYYFYKDLLASLSTCLALDQVLLQ